MTICEPEDDATRTDTERKYISLTMRSECFTQLATAGDTFYLAHAATIIKHVQYLQYITFTMCLGDTVTYRSVRSKLLF